MRENQSPQAPLYSVDFSVLVSTDGFVIKSLSDLNVSKLLFGKTISLDMP